MAALLPILFAVAAGLCVAVQSPSNAMLARATGSVWYAATVSFLGGTTLLLLIWALIDRTPAAALRQAPPWAWIGGGYGVVFVAAVAFATPRLGLAVTLTITIAAQPATTAAIDHSGTCIPLTVLVTRVESSEHWSVVLCLFLRAQLASSAFLPTHL